MLAGAEAKATNCDKTEKHECQSSHVYSRSAKSGEQEPTDDTADDVASGKRDIEVERCDGIEACGFQENYAVAQDRITAENLSCPNDTVLRMSASAWLQQEDVTYNFGSAKVGATEAIDQFSALRFHLLLLVGVDDVSQTTLDLGRMRRTLIDETVQTVSSEIKLLATDRVPW